MNKQCQIGKCEEIYDYKHYNIFRIKGLHVKYCNSCAELLGVNK